MREAEVEEVVIEGRREARRDQRRANCQRQFPKGIVR
jgi:hypothetical protein